MQERLNIFEQSEIDKNPFVEEDSLSRRNSEDMVSTGCPNTRPIVSPEEFASLPKGYTNQAETVDR